MSLKRVLLVVTALAALAGLLTSCAASRPGETGKLQVVVAFYPLQFLAERIAGDAAEVTSLTHPGAEPHDVELTAREVASVVDADLVVYEKTFQPAVDEAVAQSGNAHVLDTTSIVPLQPAPPGLQDEEQGNTNPDHDHSGLDPHVWLDPNNMITIASAITDRLAAARPDDATRFRDNLALLTKELNALDGDYRTGLATCATKTFITTHAAFAYLARRYGLTQIGITGLDPDQQPSPARIAAIQSAAKQHKVTTIFYETLVSPAVAKSIAGDLGLRTDVLDPIEGITPESRGTDYVAIMRSNLTALRTAEGCS